MKPAPCPFVLLAALALTALGCYSPVNSQEYFQQAAAEDYELEVIYSTSLYTVYYDHALKRCVMHSSYTWGHHGGGGGGTGVGVAAFRCEPDRIRHRLDQIDRGIRPADEPPPKKKQQAPRPAAPAAATTPES